MPRAQSEAGLQPPSLPLLGRAPLGSEQLPSSGHRPGTPGQHHRGFANPSTGWEEDGGGRTGVGWGGGRGRP